MGIGVGSAATKVEVEIRRYDDGPDCDVLVSTPRRRLVMSCPTYDDALRWALLECKVYGLPAVIGRRPPGARRPVDTVPGALRTVSEMQKFG